MNATDTAKTALHVPLDALEHRLAEAHDEWVSHRDADLVRRQNGLTRRLLRYFDPEVRHVERVPPTGPVLVVGNHSGYVYMPDAMATSLALVEHRGLEVPTHGLTYDLLFAVPVVGRLMRRLGALPAGSRAAEAALHAGAAVVVYPGGDWENSRPWSERNRIDFHGRKGFVRLALRTGVPVVPVVSHGAHDVVFVLSRGDRVARALDLTEVKVHVMPLLFGPPFGLSVAVPPLPLPAKVTVEFLDPLDWSGHGPEAANDDEVVEARYEEITDLLQHGLDRLQAERPHPLLSRFGIGRRPASPSARQPVAARTAGDRSR